MSHTIVRVVWFVTALLLIVACGGGTPTEPPPTPTPVPLPLSEPGPYFPGKRVTNVVDRNRGDPSRDGRAVEIVVWYPAIRPEGYAGTVANDAEPAREGAPYPLIVCSAKVGWIFAPLLTSHGFAVAGVGRIDSYRKMNQEMIDQPLDILFALDTVATSPPEGLEGVIDADRAGAMGYSFDGYNALAMSGARIDPAYYLAQCPAPDATTAPLVARTSAFDCAPASVWHVYVAHAGPAITGSEDGLWQPLTDARIRAVMPLAAEGWWLFGERGLAAVDRPVLMIAGTADELYAENVLIYEHLGTSDKAFVSFLGQGHMMIDDADMVARMGHFAVAFFGVHLQGREELAGYVSEAFVNRYADLAWGPVDGE